MKTQVLAAAVGLIAQGASQLGALPNAGPATTHAQTPSGRPTIVLVHGGFVDGSGWQGVYAMLRKDGYTVRVVQNSTTSLANDVAATRQVLAAEEGPVLLVGHSYGGVVITEAGNDPKVVGLVYIAAFAPDRRRVGVFAHQGPGARCAGAADPPPAGRLLAPRSRDPGIGKTTILDAFLAQIAAPQGVLIFTGSCVEQFGTGEAYLPVLAALGAACRAPDGGRIVDLLGRHAPTWLVQMPGLVTDESLRALLDASE